MSDSLNTFKQKLAGNEYASLTGAKRAIGKFHGMSDKEREKARVMATEHFGGTSETKPAAKPAAKESPAKKTKGKGAGQAKKALAAKKAGTAKTGQVKVTKANGNGKKSSSVGPGKERLAKKAPVKKATKKTSAKKGAGRSKTAAATGQPTPSQELTRANDVIDTTERVVLNVKRVADLDSDIDIKSVLKTAAENLEAAGRIAASVVGIEPRPRHQVQPLQQATSESAPEAVPTNGAGVPSVTMPGATGLPTTAQE